MADNQKSVRSGDILFCQGDVPREIYTLQSGSLELIAAPAEFAGLDRSIILSKSVRVALLQAKTMVVGLSPQLSQPCRVGARALDDVVVTVTPLRGGGITGLASSDPSTTISLLRQLYTSVKNIAANTGKHARLYRTIAMILDNLGLIYGALGNGGAPAALERAAVTTSEAFAAGGGVHPGTFTAQFLVTDNSAALRKRYQLPIDAPLFQPEELTVKYLKLEPAVVAPVFKADPSMAEHMYQALSDNMTAILDWSAAMAAHTDALIDTLVGGGESWATYGTDRGGFADWLASGRVSPDFVKAYLSLLVKVNGLYEELYGRKLTAIFPGVKKIHVYYTAAPAGGAVSPAARGGVGGTTTREAPAVVPGGALSRSIQQIFEFALWDKEQQTRLLKLLKDFRTMKDPLNTEPEGRKLRSLITRMYWDLYKQVFLRSRSESAPPVPARLMLRFGFLDDTLLEREQVSDLLELLRLNERTSDVIPVVSENEFLTMIMDGQEEPSINEMGLTFQAFMAEQEKHRSGKEKDVVKVDEKVRILMYEVDQRLASTARVCSGSTQTAFPILNSFTGKGSLKNIYLTKAKVEEITRSVMGIDYSLFFRETVLKMGTAREIIQEEVMPYFILLPISGGRTMAWQELVGINRRSRARIVLPTFFMGDLYKNLVHSFACFRWEINKTIKGGGWADPVEGGITGEYFDYVNTYKKMSKLSVEAKEKIGMRFKSLRTNRDRFADDYIQWVMYEKDGIPKQNTVVREMFFKYVPFSREVRERLETMPAFAQASVRYKNIQRKVIEGYERRYNKYTDNQGNLPPDLQKYLEFLKR